MLLAQGQICAKVWLFICLLAVLGSQGIVVKCTAATFFRTVDIFLTYKQILLRFIANFLTYMLNEFKFNFI